MTIHHHQGEALLLDYASGALGEAWSLAVATHLALCPDCRRELGEIEALGGVLLESAAPAPLAAGALEAVMARLDKDEAAPELASGFPPGRAPGPESEAEAAPLLPQPLRDYVGGDIDSLAWRRLGFGAYQLPIPTGEKGVTARLLRIPGGGAVPDHGHGGPELTLVLCGAFSDASGRYGRGDIQVTDESIVHQPLAEPGEDCVCLAVTDAPLRFKSLAARLVQPFLGI